MDEYSDVFEDLAGTGGTEVKRGDDKGMREKRMFGALEGECLWMSDDFDEPLEDFKDYM